VLHKVKKQGCKIIRQAKRSAGVAALNVVNLAQNISAYLSCDYFELAGFHDFLRGSHRAKLTQLRLSLYTSFQELKVDFNANSKTLEGGIKPLAFIAF